MGAKRKDKFKEIENRVAVIENKMTLIVQILHKLCWGVVDSQVPEKLRVLRGEAPQKD